MGRVSTRTPLARVTTLATAGAVDVDMEGCAGFKAGQGGEPLTGTRGWAGALWRA
jgi:hypothetical protein